MSGQDPIVDVHQQGFHLTENGDGYFVKAEPVGQSVDYKSSPTVVTFDPPIGPITGANLGTLYIQAQEAIAKALKP